jgi:NAD(P)-dependent dehydrogenase (short-subunit alcohol dehydrogenase family)
MDSFEPNYAAVIIGASGGIGRGFYDHLLKDERCGHLYVCVRHLDKMSAHDKATAIRLDYDDLDTIEAAAVQVKKDASAKGLDVRLILVATGMLHEDKPLDIQPEKSMRALDADIMARSYHINAIGPALAAKAFLPLFPREGKSVFAAISARVSSISDNHLGGWYSYRASKSALNMHIKTLAIEYGRKNKNAVIMGLHPGTVDTALSEPFQSNVKPEKLFAPDDSAGDLLKVVNATNAQETGLLKAYDGSVIPF